MYIYKNIHLDFVLYLFCTEQCKSCHLTGRLTIARMRPVTAANLIVSNSHKPPRPLKLIKDTERNIYLI